MTTGKTIALTRRTFVGKVMSLLFNMLSGLIITFLPRSKRLLISRLQSPSAVILESKKIKSATVSTVSPCICHEVMGPDAMILVFWMLSFKPTFSLSSFTFIKRLFSCYSLSAIRVVSSAYLRLLLFLPEILIPACASSSPVAFSTDTQNQPWCAASSSTDRYVCGNTHTHSHNFIHPPTYLFRQCLQSLHCVSHIIRGTGVRGAEKAGEPLPLTPESSGSTGRRRPLSHDTLSAVLCRRWVVRMPANHLGSSLGRGTLSWVLRAPVSCGRRGRA